MEEHNSNWFTAVLVILVIWFALFHQQKYEGQTAEEWFNEYDYSDQLNRDLQNEYDDLESEYDDLKDCVENYAYSEEYEDLASIYSCL